MNEAAALSAGAAVFLLLASIAMLGNCWLRNRREKLSRERNKREKVSRERKDLEKGQGQAQPTAKVSAGPEEEADGTTVIKRFSWDEIERMTDKFSSSVVGEGGYSKVYRATLTAGEIVAVKIQINGGGSERLRQVFVRELDILSKVRHPNVIRVIGFCDETDERALVMEYAPNGTLHEKLHSERDPECILSWECRMRIALQLAQAVNHLHTAHSLPILHRDIKSSNLILDKDYNIKLCDFGSALSGFGQTVSAKTIEGSIGYTDPHYIRTGVISKKSDVYSVGVLLYELITGDENKRPLGDNLIDFRLRGNYDKGQAATMLGLAARCVAELPGLRPSMEEVVGEIERMGIVDGMAG